MSLPETCGSVERITESAGARSVWSVDVYPSRYRIKTFITLIKLQHSLASLKDHTRQMTVLNFVAIPPEKHTIQQT